MNKRAKTATTCELCLREVSFVTRHHLVPKEEGGRYFETVNLCQPCHSTIHLHLSNLELAQQYRSLSALQQAAPLQKYLRWIKNKKLDNLKNRRGKR
jgi:hypothetical protein